MSRLAQIKHITTDKRRYSSILLLSIYSTQVTTAAILDNLGLVTNYISAWTAFYYVLSFFAAIPQAGFSDDSGRKKHLLIASSCVLAAAICLFITATLQISSLTLPNFLLTIIAVLPTCTLLGLTGNAIPIARGCLATLKVHDFRASIGLTTVCIGLGWVTVNLIGFIFDPKGVVLFSVVLQAIVTLFIKIFYNFSEKAHENSNNLFKTIYKSYKWCVSMLLVAGGTAAICAYLFTETSFYQIYTLDELSDAPAWKKVIGLLMGFAYLTGVVVQWITNPSDKNSIKFGAIFSFTFLLMFYALNYIENLGYVWLKELDSLKIYGIIQFLFAFGFGLFVPALFSLMSKKVHPNHIGRLFGAVDTADTV